MSNQISNRHLQYFMTVAEELHFRKAAERLFISQPGLSRQIKQLESSLGFALFERHNRKVKLTQSGAYLKNELAVHFQNLEHVINHAKLLAEGIQGDLSFGYVGSAMQQLIPDLMLKFRKEHPKVSFNLREMDNQKQIEELLSRKIDIGFVRMERVPRGIEIKPVVQEPFCLVLPKNHPLDVSNFTNLSQCKEEQFILFDPEYSASYFEQVMQIFDDSGFTPLVSHNTIHASSIFKLVENHFGLSIVPQSLQNGYNMNIKFIPLDNIAQRTVLSIVWNQQNRNPILQNFLKLV
ncbi:LysR family transcriptional regulator [Flavobacteriaceae bacterium F08102]|nr:LysR family transcriptional regulator [Flavobacteriaceae bacterium F08102]